MPGVRHARHLLGVDDVLDRRGLAPAPLLRPVDRGPAALVQPALPVLASLHGCGRCSTTLRRGRRPRSSSPPQSARNFGRFSSSHARSSSRNASSSGRVGEIHRTNTNIRVRFLGRPRSVGFHLQRRSRRAARVGARVPRRARRRADTCARWPTTSAASPTRCGTRSSELGWPGLLVPEANGGLGLGLVDMAVVLGGDGATAVPGPVLLVGGLRHPRGTAPGASRPARAARNGCDPGNGRARGAGPRRPRRPRAHPRPAQGRRLGAHR